MIDFEVELTMIESKLSYCTHDHCNLYQSDVEHVFSVFRTQRLLLKYIIIT